MVRQRVSKKSKSERSLQKAGGKVGMYQGESPGPVEVRESDPSLVAVADKLGPRLFRFALWCAKTGNHALAARKLEPTLSIVTARNRGCTWWKQVVAKLAPEEMTALNGVTRRATEKAVADAFGATVVKSFVMPKTGKIVETEPRPDHQTRLQAAAMSAKLLKLTDEREGGQVTVNIVSYLGNPVTATPWPGGGRAGADGIMRPTVGPGSHAALAVTRETTPAVPVEFSASGERDD